MILGRRPRKSGRRGYINSTESICFVFQSAPFVIAVATSLNDMTAIDAKYDYEYLVKYKNLSYLHVQWLTANEIGSLCNNFLALNIFWIDCPLR